MGNISGLQPTSTGGMEFSHGLPVAVFQEFLRAEDSSQPARTFYGGPGSGCGVASVTSDETGFFPRRVLGKNAPVIRARGLGDVEWDLSPIGLELPRGGGRFSVRSVPRGFIRRPRAVQPEFSDGRWPAGPGLYISSWAARRGPYPLHTPAEELSAFLPARVRSESQARKKADRASPNFPKLGIRARACSPSAQVPPSHPSVGLESRQGGTHCLAPGGELDDAGGLPRAQPETCWGRIPRAGHPLASPRRGPAGALCASKQGTPTRGALPGILARF